MQSDVGLHRCNLASLCYWSRKLAPFSQPIRCKTKTNHDLVFRVFPRFRRGACFSFEFLLVLHASHSYGLKG